MRGLIGTFPARLDLRERMAELCRADGDFAQAGRWSYLSETRVEEEVAAFERHCAGDPRQLERMLRWNPEDTATTTETARVRLAELDDRIANYVAPPGRRDWEPEPLTLGGKIRGVIWATVGGICVVLVLLGLGKLLTDGAQIVVNWLS